MTLNVKRMMQSEAQVFGEFSDNSRIAQHIKSYIRVEVNARRARGQLRPTDAQLEALDMIAVCIGNILAGSPDHEEHWHNISLCSLLANTNGLTNSSMIKPEEDTVTKAV